MFENGLSAPKLLKEQMDFSQPFTDILLGHEQELIRFLLSRPNFQGHGRSKNVEKWQN